MIPWITSAGTLVAVWLSGRNLRLSWKVSLANQAMWLVFIITYEAWGLLPLTLALSGIFARHLWTTRDSAGATSHVSEEHRRRCRSWLARDAAADVAAEAVADDAIATTTGGMSVWSLRRRGSRRGDDGTSNRGSPACKMDPCPNPRGRKGRTSSRCLPRECRRTAAGINEPARAPDRRSASTWLRRVWKPLPYGTGSTSRLHACASGIVGDGSHSER